MAEDEIIHAENYNASERRLRAFTRVIGKKPERKPKTPESESQQPE